MPQYFGLKFKLPKPVAPVAHRELSVSVNGDRPATYTLPGSNLESGEIVFAETDSYDVTLVDVSETGHRSVASSIHHGTVAEDLRPLPPAAPEVGDKRSITEAEATSIRADQAKKAAEESRAAQDKEAAEAKALAEADAAHKKAVADAAAKADAAKLKPAPPATMAPKPRP